MLTKFFKEINLPLIDVAKALDVNNGYVSKVVRGQTYKSKESYDSLYDVMESKNARVPRANGVVAYPAFKAKGSWDIWIDDKFAATLCFQSAEDVMNFVHGKDERLAIVKSLMVTETQFDNMVRVY